MPPSKYVKAAEFIILSRTIAPQTLECADFQILMNLVLDMNKKKLNYKQALEDPIWKTPYPCLSSIQSLISIVLREDSIPHHWSRISIVLLFASDIGKRYYPTDHLFLRFYATYVGRCIEKCVMSWPPSTTDRWKYLVQKNQKSEKKDDSIFQGAICMASFLVMAEMLTTPFLAVLYRK